jgi:hypothetical protein
MKGDNEMSSKQIEESAKIKVGIIGVGNAGGQVAVQAAQNGHNVLLINSSSKDLSSNLIPDNIPSMTIGDRRGCGKNRDIGKGFIKAYYANLFAEELFLDLVKPCDIIVVIASTAGGTGSGVSPFLVNRIEATYPGKTVIFYGILPKLSESVKAHANTNECMSEVLAINVPYMLADLSAFEGEVNDVAYKKIADHIVQTLNVIRGDYTYESKYGMIDERDLSVILSEPGYIAVYNMTVDQHILDNAGMQSLLISYIKDNPIVKIQRNQIIKEMGIMISMPEELIEKTKTGDYSELTNFIGVPLDIFENYSITSEPKGKISLIMSGLTVPVDRMTQGNDIIVKHMDALAKVKSFDLETHKDITAAKNMNKIGPKSNNELVSTAPNTNIPDIFN